MWEGEEEEDFADTNLMCIDGWVRVIHSKIDHSASIGRYNYVLFWRAAPTRGHPFTFERSVPHRRNRALEQINDSTVLGKGLQNGFSHFRLSAAATDVRGKEARYASMFTKMHVPYRHQPLCADTHNGLTYNNNQSSEILGSPRVLILVRPRTL